ncbi:DUF819 family protein [Luteibaculum oceani]|uniref:DUF819 family protein n=1 Tax=Luteibaculum oceani TaxID=1294296 RepID=A0A5C6V286_9FLAO|nr:DUF819 family protein [Luteibaculum oceani]TXC78556.1 DUF819 family protein [Luteibaculum oceani]
MPLFTNDAIVLGILMGLLGLVFYTSSSKNPFWQKFYKVIPALLLCYFLPAIFNSLGIISGEESNLYFVASRYLLPAALILLCIAIDLKSIINLGPKALIMFFTATLGIVIGGPIALAIVGSFAPEAVGGEGANAIWRGLATVAGSWIGGGANQTAMKEIYGASDTLFSAMIVVDVFVANLWMAFLLYGAGKSDAIDKKLKADNSAIAELKKKVEDYQAQITKTPTTGNIMILFALVFIGVGLSHWFSDLVAPGLDAFISNKIAGNPDSGWKFLTSLGSGFFWIVVIATTVGVAFSFTPIRKMEGYGASKYGSIFIYILVATIGMKMDIGELISQWQVFKFLILVGLIWMLIHVSILLGVAKLVKAPFFFVAIGSQANVGGAASAPVVASAFAPALAPVGVLLAVLGYALGTFGAILCATLLQTVAL